MARRVAALCLGVPAGILCGRVAWQVSAHQLGILPVVVLPVLALGGLVAAALALAVAVAASPGEAAAGRGRLRSCAVNSGRILPRAALKSGVCLLPPPTCMAAHWR
jgi:hypothetical protein